jgi:hypothetical protein
VRLVEILLVVAVIAGAWLHGYSRGKRKNQVVEMSARDLRRELKRRQ